MVVKKEALEFVLNDEDIEELISQLEELKESKMQVHYELTNGQINLLNGGDLIINEFLIHHDEEEE